MQLRLNDILMNFCCRPDTCDFIESNIRNKNLRLSQYEDATYTIDTGKEYPGIFDCNYKFVFVGVDYLDADLAGNNINKKIKEYINVVSSKKVKKILEEATAKIDEIEWKESQCDAAKTKGCYMITYMDNDIVDVYMCDNPILIKKYIEKSIYI